MFDQLPTDIQRKIITSLPPLSLATMSNISSSVRKMGLLHLLLPAAYESLFSIEDYDRFTVEELKKDRDNMNTFSFSAYKRWAMLYDVPVWRIYIQELMHTIDSMICKTDNKFNHSMFYFGLRIRGHRLPKFYTSRNATTYNRSFIEAKKLGWNRFQVPSIDELVNYNNNKRIQLSFYALVY